MNFERYLLQRGFEKYLKRLNKKLKNKKIIVYAAGALFQFICKNYDLSKLNIIGISDRKFLPDDSGKTFMGYKIIPLDKIKEYNPDVVLIAMQEYMTILEDFSLGLFKNTNIKVYPLVRVSILESIKKIWRK